MNRTLQFITSGNPGTYETLDKDLGEIYTNAQPHGKQDRELDVRSNLVKFEVSSHQGVN
jgi:hypothetical protein